jgi:hypothetical protein
MSTHNICDCWCCCGDVIKRPDIDPVTGFLFRSDPNYTQWHFRTRVEEDKRENGTKDAKTLCGVNMIPVLCQKGSPDTYAHYKRIGSDLLERYCTVCLEIAEKGEVKDIYGNVV